MLALYPVNYVLCQITKRQAGLAVVIKDNFCTTDVVTTCASWNLSRYLSPFESTAVSLLRKAKCVIMGKANMDEFAMGSNNAHTYFDKVKNPIFEEARSPGGSSGGSAAAVAANYCDVALGTDTGGSVRLPAAYCSVLGFKPTYGLISRHGVISYAQSFDTVGILAREFGPLEEAFDVINQHDPKDPTCLNEHDRSVLGTLIEERNAARTGDKLRIGIIEEAIIDLDPQVCNQWITLIQDLQQLGHTVSTVSVPTLKYALHTYYTLAPSEASSNLARYDGIRYGQRATMDQIDDVLYAGTRTLTLGEEVKRRIMLGTFNLTSSEYDEHFVKAQKVRRKLVREFNSVFALKNKLFSSDETGEVDILIHPTARAPPPTFEQVAQTDPVDDYVNDVLTLPANIAGLPAISVPSQVPGVGLQVWGQYGDDKMVLDAAKIVQDAIYSH